ncbi:MAG: glycosyltransferase family 39 protein [Chitinophagaceae bacterium]
MNTSNATDHRKSLGYLVLAAFVIAKIVMQYLVVNPVYDLQRDEYLHLDQGLHLAWGYQSVPPVTSWISWLIIKLGNGLFWVKFFPALFGALTIVVVWRGIDRMGGGLFACVLAATGLFCSVLVRINILYQPNSLDILSWTVVYYTLLRYFQTSRNKYLYLMAVAFAVGFLNKYNIAFCLIGLLAALGISHQRRIFLNPHLYYAALLALLLISPNLLWQFQNDLPVLKHMKELAETQLVHVNRMDFVKEQILFFIGSLFIILAAFISFFSFTPNKPYRVFFWAYLITIGLFIYFQAKAYYAIGLYPIFFVFGSVYLAWLLKRGSWFYLRYACIAVILFFFYVLLQAALPLYRPGKYAEDAAQHRPFSSHTWEDGKKYPISQDFADMLGWRELARKVDSVYGTLEPKSKILVLCDNYGQAGAINYYTRQKGLQADAFIPDYIKWVNLDREIEHVIRIKTARNTNFTRDHGLFEIVEVLTTIENSYAREKGTQVILLSKPKVDIGALLRKERSEGNLQ